MQTIKDLVDKSMDKVSAMCTAMYDLVTGFRTPHVLNITSTTMDLSTVNILQDTIILTGTLTGNTTVVLGTAQRKYTVINSCTGNFYVWVKTTSGTGVYMVANDCWLVYCNSISILPFGLQSVRPSMGITLESFTATVGVANSIPLSSATITNNLLSEITNNTFVPKNSGVYQITGYCGGNTAMTNINLKLYINGVQVAPHRAWVTTATAEIRISISTTLNLLAGDVVSIVVTPSATTTAYYKWSFISQVK